MQPDEDGANRPGPSKKYEARVRATLPILEIFEHAREALIRLERRTADVTPRGTSEGAGAVAVAVAVAVGAPRADISITRTIIRNK